MSFRLLSVRRKRALHPSNGTYYYTLQTVENKKAVKKPWYQDLLTAICAKRSTQPLYQRLGASMEKDTSLIQNAPGSHVTVCSICFVHTLGFSFIRVRMWTAITERSGALSCSESNENFLFANTSCSAKASAVMYSFVETAKENGGQSIWISGWGAQGCAENAVSTESRSCRKTPPCGIKSLSRVAWHFTFSQRA